MIAGLLARPGSVAQASVDSMVTAPPMDETAGLAVLHGIHSGAYRPIGITPRTMRVEAEVLVKADLGKPYRLSSSPLLSGSSRAGRGCAVTLAADLDVGRQLIEPTG